MSFFRADRGSSLFEVSEYGPIVFASDPSEYGGDDPVLITINGSYLNWWNPCGEGRWENVDCRSGFEGDLYTLTVSAAMDLAKAWYEEEVNGVDEDSEEEEATEEDE